MKIRINERDFDWEGRTIYPGEKPRSPFPSTTAAVLVVIAGAAAAYIWYQYGFQILIKFFGPLL